MYTRRFLLNTLIILALLLSTSASVSLAQNLPPVMPEEPGVAENAQPVPPVMPQSATQVTSAYGGGASYDSGWLTISPDSAITLQHNLGGDTDDYVVDLQYRAADVNGINQRYYGGADFGSSPAPGHSADDSVAAYWRSLTTSSITVFRRSADSYAEQIRVRIWVDAGPDYDSGWVSMSKSVATTFTHSLGGNADDYVVDMQYRSSGSGVNQRYYGGADFGATAFGGSVEDNRVGVYWRTLTNSSLVLYRRAEDSYASEVRVRIWVRPTATYDSGWVSINQNQARTLTHAIGGNVDDYRVDMEYKSAGSGINQRYYGGADFGANPPGGMNANDRVGAYWRSLTNNSIVIYRRPEDIYAPQVRIRIWHAWTPPAPDYDSGWQSLSTGVAKTLTHNLGGSTADYYVDMQYQTADVNGINARYIGGADFGTNPAPGHSAEDRVAVYWRSLTNSSITLYRRAEDTYAPQVRIRIWVMPEPDYDSGWVSLTAGAAATTLTHNLDGDTSDYLVDMQYNGGGNGVNQRYYGGADFGSHPPGGMSADDRVGAYWRSLTTSSITVYRRPDDIYAPQVRVRIWRMAKPDYDSNWFTIAQNAASTLTHNLGGNNQAYLVNIYQWDTSSANYLNHRHFGGADFGSSPPSGYAENNRVGTYWRTLTRNQVTVYRRPEDGFADWVRVRIWDTSAHIYLPSLSNP